MVITLFLILKTGTQNWTPYLFAYRDSCENFNVFLNSSLFMYSLQSCKFFLLFLALKSANPGNILPQKLKTLVFRLPCLIFALTNVEHSICVELCDRLQLSRRTLQDYRNNGIIPYIQLGGKILYRESDIQKILMANYREAYRMKGV